MQVQVFKPKCPFCGWVRTIELDIEEDQVTVVKGISNNIKEFIANFKIRKEIDCWIDMPPCPECGRIYQYNTDTGETKR